MWLLDHISHNFTSGLGSNKISPPFTVNGMSQLRGFISWLFKINYFNNMSPHYKHIYLCHPPFPPLNVCHLCQMCMKPNLRSAGPISPSPLLPLLWEFTSDGVIIPRSPLFPHPPIFDDVELDHLLPLLVPVQLHHLPPLSPPFCRQ